MRPSWLTAAAAVCLAASPLAAQADRPVVFVNGLGETSGAWAAAADALSSQLAITPFRPTIYSGDYYEYQAAVLGNYGDAFFREGNAVAVSHSNGGVVTRQFGRTAGSNRNIVGNITVGTPHRGALLADNVRNGALVHYVDEVSLSLLAAVDFSTLRDPGFALERQYQTMAIVLLNTMVGILNHYAHNVAGVFANVPVLSEMGPGSLFMAGLNGGTSLAAEAGVFQRRIGIATEIPAAGAWTTLACKDYAGTCLYVQQFVEVYARAKAAQYSVSSDPLIVFGSLVWLNLAEEMAAMDTRWLDMIGARASDGQPLAQDGVVPVPSQEYPNATDPTIHLPNVGHFQQPTNPDVIRSVRDALITKFDMPVRPPLPPPVVNPPPEFCGGHWEVRPVYDGEGQETGSYENVWVDDPC